MTANPSPGPASGVNLELPPLIAALFGRNGRPLPRIHVLSDLHRGTGAYEIPADLEFDILVAAGDIGAIEDAVGWLAKIGKPVVYVLGNHEYWGHDCLEAVALAKTAARGTAVHVLERDSVTIQGVRFLGATLWSSFGNWHDGLVGQAAWRMRDYEYVTAHKWFATPANQRWFRAHCRRAGMDARSIEDVMAKGQFHPAIAYQLHCRAVAWLERALYAEYAGPTVVVTHHAPTFDSLRSYGVAEGDLDPGAWNARGRNDEHLKAGCYASDLPDLLPGRAEVIDLWVHGHLHRGLDFLTTGTRVVCNPRGAAMPPLDSREARMLALFGMRVTDEDIAQDQARQQEDPYRGDAWGFEPKLVVDLATVAERPLRQETAKVLPYLHELLADSREILVPLRRARPQIGSYLARCLDQNIDAFNQHVEKLMAQIGPLLNPRGFAFSDVRPPCPWTPMPAHEGPQSTAEVVRFYTVAADWMQRGISWLEALPEWGLRRAVEWVNIGQAVLAALDDAGVAARLVRPSVRDFRSGDVLRYRVITDLGTDGEASEWENWLMTQFNPSLPRTRMFRVDAAAAEDARGAALKPRALLSLDALTRAAREIADLELPDGMPGDPPQRAGLNARAREAARCDW